MKVVEGKDNNNKSKGLSVRPANRLSTDSKAVEAIAEPDEQPAPTSKARKGRSAPAEEPVAATARATRSRPIRA